MQLKWDTAFEKKLHSEHLVYENTNGKKKSIQCNCIISFVESQYLSVIYEAVIHSKIFAIDAFFYFFFSKFAA